jgi:glycosyltransferase involved in cell wall biosynthesis
VARDLRNNGVRRVTALRPFVRDPGPGAAAFGDARRVLFAGRVVPDKGLEVLLQALQHVDATLEVCGDGWGMPRCRRLADKLGLDGRVTFTGWASEAQLAEAYRRSSVVAVPSLLPEPFGLVGLEAMIHGRAVVGSDTGGIGEWLAHDVNGYLVRPGDPLALADGLERALEDPHHSMELGRAGREIALTEFSVEQHLLGLGAVYAQARTWWDASR